MSSRAGLQESTAGVPVRGLPLLALVVVLAASCSGRYDFSLRADGSADVSLSASLEPQTARLVANLGGFSGGARDDPSEDPLLEAAGIARSLRASSSVGAVSLRNPDPRSVAGTVAIRDLEGFLAAPAGAGSASASRFVRVERSPTGGRLSVDIDRAAGSALLAAISPEIVDYVSALMAPVATGEDLSRDAYLDLVASAYGKGIAAEISSAKIRATVELPGTAVSVQGGVSKGRRVDFSVPLVDLLVLDEPVRLEAVWK